MAVLVTNLVSSLNVLFVVVSLLKALIFSLNEPVKELLYIPTSQSIKYKAKAWIDVVGSRMAKGIGSSISNQAHGDANALKKLSELPNILISLILIGVAWYIGIEFEGYVKNSVVVGQTNSSPEDGDDDDAQSIIPENDSTIDTKDLPIIDGLKPGDVGYSGYDLHLFKGVFEDDDQQGIKDTDRLSFDKKFFDPDSKTFK
jgi:hypothetical protein